MKVQKEFVELGEIRQKIESFYDASIWHFVCINGLFEDNMLEIQWSFAKIGAKEEWKVFYAKAEEHELLPSMSDILPTAKMYEGELRDLLDANFEGSIKGMFIEFDGESAPLKSRK